MSRPGAVPGQGFSCLSVDSDRVVIALCGVNPNESIDVPMVLDSRKPPEIVLSFRCWFVLRRQGSVSFVTADLHVGALCWSGPISDIPGACRTPVATPADHGRLGEMNHSGTDRPITPILTRLFKVGTKKTGMLQLSLLGNGSCRFMPFLRTSWAVAMALNR